MYCHLYEKSVLCLVSTNFGRPQKVVKLDYHKRQNQHHASCTKDAR